METRLFVIRLLVLLIMAIATFTAGWYLYIRYDQLEEGSGSTESFEPNNPRINHTKITRVTDSFNNRKIYQIGDPISVYIPESDPFYTSQ